MDFEKVRQRLYEARSRAAGPPAASDAPAAAAAQPRPEPYWPAWDEFNRSGALPLHARRGARLAEPGELDRLAFDLTEYQKREAPFGLEPSPGGAVVAGLVSFDLERRIDLFVAALQLALEDAKAL